VARDVVAERQVADGGGCRSGKTVAPDDVAAGLGPGCCGGLTTGTVAEASVAYVAAASERAPSWRRMCS